MQAFRPLQRFFKAVWPVEEPATLHPGLEEGAPTPTNTLEGQHPSTPVSHHSRRRTTHIAHTSNAFNRNHRRQSVSRSRNMARIESSSVSSENGEGQPTATTSSLTRTTPSHSPRVESPWQDVTPSPTTAHPHAPSLRQDKEKTEKAEAEVLETTAPARKSSRSKKAKGVLAHLRKHGPSLVLKNTGSVARDHLASERTFLAYVRTSLALASMGVALVQLFTIADLTSRGSGTPISADSRRVQRFAKPLGITTVVFSLVLLVIGIYRFFVVQYALPHGKFPIARISVALTSFVFTSIVVVIFGALLSTRASS